MEDTLKEGMWKWVVPYTFSKLIVDALTFLCRPDCLALVCYHVNYSEIDASSIKFT